MEVCCSFQKKYIKNSKFKSFAGSSLTLSAWRVAASGTVGGKGQIPLPCTQVGRVCKKLQFLKKIEWTFWKYYFDSEIVLVFQIKPFKVAFFVFFKYQLLKVLPGWMGWVKTLLRTKRNKSKFFESFCSFAKEIDKKEQIQNFYWLIINSFNAASRWQWHQGVQGLDPPAVYRRW